MTPLSIAFYIDSVPFTRAVVDGTVSLGGSESSCLGLARALQARGHLVHLFVTKLEPDAIGSDSSGVMWHRFEDFSIMSQYIEWDLFCSLRMAQFFAGDLINARLRWLWNQDLLVGEDGANLVMASIYQVDRLMYVSDYHRKQWEGVLPCLEPMGIVVRNGYDASLVPATVTKRPHRLIHISRPERGLGPLLKMWPAVRAHVPDAEVGICRYNSMYDAAGWGKICASYDDHMRQVQETVGGIIELGELGKRDLYQAISESAAMWYPGIASFAETSCIAAIESQACRTPFVGSWKGALPETVPSGTLIRGDAFSAEYQSESVEAVVGLMHDCARDTVSYRRIQADGERHVRDHYSYQECAERWECLIQRDLDMRLRTQRPAIIRRIMHDDDPVAAKDACPDMDTAATAQWIIDGRDQVAEDYSERAIQDPEQEAKASDRLKIAAQQFKGCTCVLDVACGNGSGAIAMALAHPTIHVTGVDYAKGNIKSARQAVERLGLADRCRFIEMAIYDFGTHDLSHEWHQFAEHEGHKYDGLFVGEFLEHVANAQGLIDGLEAVLVTGATAVYTMPNGPFTEMMQRGIPIKRGHVNRFCHDDIASVFGQKSGFDPTYISCGFTQRGRPVGHWIVSYRVDHQGKAGARPLAHRFLSARPYPRLSVGLITKNAAADVARCLTSVWAIADEIVVGDTGSTDDTVAIAESFGARVLSLPAIEAIREGFSGARNAVVDACVGEWFLWIDADEVLIGANHLSKYIDTGGPYQGFVIRQQHLYVDLPSSYDIPVRLFRRVPEVRFYGCVHEQPAYRDANTELFPTLELRDVTIAHTGYLTEDVRRTKMLHRNLPLLKRDTEVFPERILGRLLVMRDYVNVAETDQEQSHGWTRRALGWLSTAVSLYDEHFADPAHKYHPLARPWYERALRGLASVGALQAFEMEIALGGRSGGLGKAHVKPERVWVRDMAEYERLVDYKTTGLAKMWAPQIIDVEPIVQSQATPDVPMLVRETAGVA